MKIVKLNQIKGTDRQVYCPKGGFISHRMLLASDNMGYTITITDVPRGSPQKWHYKNHLESCYCISGRGVLTNLQTGKAFWIEPETLYVLDLHDEHTLEARNDMRLLCVFNPPLIGKEVHKEDGSY